MIVPASFPDPQRVRLDSFAALDDAIDRLLPLAQQRIAIFDADLRAPAWNGNQRSENLQRFPLASRTNQLRVVLHETDYVARYQSRIMELLRRFSDRMEIRCTQNDVKQVFDPFVLIDGQHYLHRFHYQRPGGEFGIAQPEAAGELSLRFEELWLASDPGLAPTVLGL